jgi:hypothetical protein
MTTSLGSSWAIESANTSESGLWRVAEEGVPESTMIVGCVALYVSIDCSGSPWMLSCSEASSKDSSDAKSDAGLEENLRCGTDRKVTFRIDHAV